MKGFIVDVEADKNPEVALAVAVIQRAVIDIRAGCANSKRRAVEDIRAGLLDYWVEIVASSYDVADELNRQLRDLAG